MLSPRRRVPFLQGHLKNASGRWRGYGKLLRDSGDDFVWINRFGDVSRDKELSRDGSVVLTKILNNGSRKR